MKHDIEKLAFDGAEDAVALALRNANPTDMTGFDDVAKTGDWLERLQLFGSSSKKCKQGKIPMGAHALVKSEDVFEVLGMSVDVLVCAWRPKALDMSGDAIISVYDHKDPMFAKIQEKADIKDSECMFGPEFLLWIPSVQRFATYFMGSKTARNESIKLKPLITKRATIGSQLIDNKKYQWHGPTIVECSAPLTPPDVEKLVKELQKFKNPPANTVEEVAPGTERDR